MASFAGDVTLMTLESLGKSEPKNSMWTRLVVVEPDGAMELEGLVEITHAVDGSVTLASGGDVASKREV